MSVATRGHSPSNIGNMEVTMPVHESNFDHKLTFS
jgi:hypothetical protein